MYTPNPNQSPTANRGWQRVFQRGKLTLGIMFPIEAFERDQPTMHNQVALAQFAEKAGFSSLGFRDVPLRDRILAMSARYSTRGLISVIWPRRPQKSRC